MEIGYIGSRHTQNLLNNQSVPDDAVSCSSNSGCKPACFIQLYHILFGSECTFRQFTLNSLGISTFTYKAWTISLVYLPITEEFRDSLEFPKLVVCAKVLIIETL